MDQEAEIVTDADGRICSWNDEAARLYGYDAHEVIGSSIWLLAPTSRSAQIAASWARVVQGERLAYEATHLAKGGSQVLVTGTAEPRFGPDGRVVGVTGRMRPR